MTVNEGGKGNGEKSEINYSVHYARFLMYIRRNGIT